LITDPHFQQVIHLLGLLPASTYSTLAWSILNLVESTHADLVKL
jgi:hypothetical protein